MKKPTIQELLDTPITQEDAALAQKALRHILELIKKDVEEWSEDLSQDLSKFTD